MTMPQKADAEPDAELLVRPYARVASQAIRP
jgi:hypothetical protein